MQLLSETQVNDVLAGRVNDRIEEMEAWMLEYEQVECPVIERFVNGMYAREIVIPKGTLLTGRVHKHGHLAVMISGDIALATPDGVQRLTEHAVMEVPPGRKRAGYAFEETRWLTLHRTDQVDEGDMIEHLTFFSMSQYREHVRQRDRSDYRATIETMGLSEDEIQGHVRDHSDMVDMATPFKDWVTVGESIIDGYGIKARRDFEIGDVIGPARTPEGMRTLISRYVNHSAYPNAVVDVDEYGGVWLVATCRIPSHDEITTHYGLTLESVQGALCQQ